MESLLSEIETLLIERGFRKQNARRFVFSPNVIRITGCSCNGGKNRRMVHKYNASNKAYLELKDAPNYIKKTFEIPNQPQS